MKYLKWIVAVAISLVVLGSAIYYYYFLAEPSTLPSKDELIQEINQTLPKAQAKMVQDIVKVDKRHLFIPFRTNLGYYALSTWEWKGHTWQVSFIDTRGEPRLWKLVPDDPASYRLIWNINPHNQVKYLDLYFMRRRDYVISDEVGRYYPKIQVKQRFEMAEAPYNVSPLPSVWKNIMIDISKTSSKLQRNELDNQLNLEIGWMSFNDVGKVTYPSGPNSGQGFNNGDADMEYLMPLSETDIAE